MDIFILAHWILYLLYSMYGLHIHVGQLNIIFNFKRWTELWSCNL